MSRHFRASSQRYSKSTRNLTVRDARWSPLVAVVFRMRRAASLTSSCAYDIIEPVLTTDLGPTSSAGVIHNAGIQKPVDYVSGDPEKIIADTGERALCSLARTRILCRADSLPAPVSRVRAPDEH